MDKSPAYALQLIDCNCNDCGFMKRDIERFNKSLNDHHRWQLDYFNVIRDNLYAKSDYWVERGDLEKSEVIKKEADKMKFQFDKKEAAIHYGHCQKFDKGVSFIPVTCQIETQKCFKHRNQK